MPRPDEVIGLLRGRGASVATAESLTGGALCAALVGPAGASAVVRGGIVAYTPEMKARLLGVDPELIARAGVVSPEVAEAMARGIRDATGAAYGVGTTGAAGPEGHDRAPAGRVHVCVVGPHRAAALRLDLEGDRSLVTGTTVQAALDALARMLAEDVTQA